MPLEAIELLRELLQSLSFLQICFFGLKVLGIVVRRGMDVVIDFLFSHLLKSVMARDGREEIQSKQWCIIV